MFVRGSDINRFPFLFKLKQHSHTFVDMAGMRLHRNLTEAVVTTLDSVFNGGSYVDKAVETVLKGDKRWGSRDRAFIAETVYEIVRWKRLYEEAVSVNAPYTREKFYKLLFVHIQGKNFSIPDWNEFRDLSADQISSKLRELQDKRSIRESVPEWLDELGMRELGEDRWTSEIKALNEQAAVVLRTNSLKTSRQKLQMALGKENISTKELTGSAEALLLPKRSNLMKTRAFQKGLFEVQDASSQKVAHFTGVKPGMEVLDACAGAGGKSLHMACLMKNQGKIIALDIYGGKLRELVKRAKRNGVSIIETRLVRTAELNDLEEKADIVLIDAPCSGLGVLRRNPGAKWKLSQEFISNCIQTQRQVLTDYSGAVKPGGKLIYVTCSILPSENAQQVQWFLNSDAGGEFVLEKAEEIWAATSGFDGFYMARLSKSN